MTWWQWLLVITGYVVILNSLKTLESIAHSLREIRGLLHGIGDPMHERHDDIMAALRAIRDGLPERRH